MHSLIRILFILLLMSACNDKVQECVCTFEHSPVCSNGEQYDNECIAKCNGVTSFSKEEVCAIPPMQPCPEGMFCAQVMPSPKIYKNECEVKASNAKVVEIDLCR